MTLVALMAMVIGGCGRHSPQPAAAGRPVVEVHETVPAALPVGTELPLKVDRPELAALILDGLRKIVMGRAASLQEIERVTSVIMPLVDAASRQPSAAPVFAAMAISEGESAEQARREWVRLQCADILIESGGDPDTISPVGAAGVAQFMPGTGVKAGLSVDTVKSGHFSRLLAPLKWRLGWLEYVARTDSFPEGVCARERFLPVVRGRSARRDYFPEGVKVLPLRCAPKQDSVPLPPGAPNVTAAAATAELPGLRAEVDALRAQRMAVDERFDPRKAIFAQTRYLLGLYSTYPGVDWLFQIYHGGTNGVDRLLARYTGSPVSLSLERRGLERGILPPQRGSTEIISGGLSGTPLTYEDVFFNVSPRSHPDAFYYLYGRGDDHRDYWWKVRAAEAAIALYTQDPVKFRAVWQSFAPGESFDAWWYPDARSEAFQDLDDLTAAMKAGSLVFVADHDLNVRPPLLDPGHARAYAVLRPEAWGALLLILDGYHQSGGTGKLTAANLTYPTTYALELRSLAKKRPVLPEAPPEGAVPDADVPDAGFDYRTTGYVFDLATPPNTQHRKILEYVLDYFKRREIVWWFVRRDTDGAPVYHIVPNPRYRVALVPSPPSPLPGRRGVSKGRTPQTLDTRTIPF